MEIINFDLQDMEDSSVLQFVSPYDISPINGTEVILSPTEKEEVLSQSTSSVNLEMEEFRDLAPYLRQSVQKLPTSYTDELNTPIIEAKRPFDFMVNESINIGSLSAASATEPLKFEYETISSSPPPSSVGNSFKQVNDFSVNSNNMSVQLQAVQDSDVVNLMQESEVHISQPSTSSGLGDIYLINNNNNNSSNFIKNETPMHNMLQEHHFSAYNKYEDNHSVVSVINDNQYSNNSSSIDDYEHVINYSSPQQKSTHQNLGIVTPEDSNSSATSSEPGSSSKKMPVLRLDLGFTATETINTPDVIDSVVSMESSFNILDYVNEKDVTTVNLEDIQFGSPSTSKITTKPPTIKRKRRAKKYDDDEDYVPPMKKTTKRTTAAKIAQYSDESDDEDDDIDNGTSKRGRSRRTSSFSSDHSDVSKYRELRDKNNEASRRSRLKRKIKEQSLEKECEDLEEKNLKLRAHVEQLEKMVNNFRSNLFKIMLKK